MSAEIQVPYGSTGGTLYTIIRNRNGLVWNTSSIAFEALNLSNWTDYDIQLTEQGVGYYTGNFPTAIIPGVYSLVAYRQSTGSPLTSDQQVAFGDLQWNGVNTLPLSDLATSGQVGQGFPIRIARGVMIEYFPLYFKSAADHITPFTSGVVSGQIARDNGSFGPLQSGAFTETGLGYYTLRALTSGDTLGNTIKLLFTANGVSGGSSDPLPMAIITQRVSGQPA